jgi:transposase
VWVQISEQVHDMGEVRMIRDLPIAERHFYLSYRTQQFKCEYCRKTFVTIISGKEQE